MKNQKNIKVNGVPCEVVKRGGTVSTFPIHLIPIDKAAAKK